MLLSKKLIQLENAVLVIKQLLNIVPDLYVHTDYSINCDFYCSKSVNKISTDIEFIEDGTSFFAHIYYDIVINVENDTCIKRVYGSPFKIKIFDNYMGYISFNNYPKILEENDSNPTLVKLINKNVMDYIINNKCKLKENTIPPSIKTLLPFI